jgi:hypothetical protein
MRGPPRGRHPQLWNVTLILTSLFLVQDTLPLQLPRYCTSSRMTDSYAPPSGAPPRQPQRAGSMDDTHDDPPPAYTPSASQGDQHVSAGPAHLELSRPPLEQHITGVGEGFGPRTHNTSNAWTGGDAGSSTEPPRLPSRIGSSVSTPSHAGPSGGQLDLSPTESPTPGRPLLYHGQMLVYPKGHFCAKCERILYLQKPLLLIRPRLGGNTGYQANDPSNPHTSVCHRLSCLGVGDY